MKAVSELRKKQLQAQEATTSDNYEKQLRVTTSVNEFHHSTLADRAFTRATPPTLDDLFVELYMDQLITQHELSESINIVPTLD